MDLKVYMVKETLTTELDAASLSFLTELEEQLNGKVTIVDMQQPPEQDYRILYVASGGSENQFKENFDTLTDRPCYLLTRGGGNSLAASMEILSYLQQRGRNGEIIHGDIVTVANRLRAIARAYAAKKALNGKKLGVIGAPSDWLIASISDREMLRKKLGIEVEDVSLQELYDEYEKGGYVENRWTQLLKQPGRFDAAEVEKALNVYGALRRIVDRRGLGGITVRCFDLLTSIETTGCLALAILNAEGICSGCEGDLPSLVSMAILGEVSGEPVFMCNPSRMDVVNNELIFAHCTLPMNMPYEFELKTHFESNIGVAIAGSIPEKECTIFKASNDLGRFYCDEGAILQNLREDTLCRSQIRMKLPDVGYFLKNPISNHHLVCCGRHKAAMQEFISLLG